MSAFIINELFRTYTEDDCVYLEEACSKDKIEELRFTLSNNLPEKSYKEYLSLLSFSNGLQIQNVTLYSCAEFLEKYNENQENKNKHYEIGYSGNLDAYIFNIKNQEFNVVNFYNPIEVFSTYETIHNLLSYILETQVPHKAPNNAVKRDK